MERPAIELTQALARRLVEEPASWPDVRAGVRERFDAIAAGWDEIATRDGHLAPLEAVVGRLSGAERVLDLGTGSGRGADLVARRAPGARVTGADLSEAMLREAAAREHPSGVSFVAADAATLPFRDASFDAVVALNMLLFLGEAVRVLRPGGVLAVLYSAGENTPVYVPTDVVRPALAAAGIGGVEEGRAGDGLWLVGRRP